MSSKRKLVWLIVLVISFLLIILFAGNEDSTIKQNNQAIIENNQVVLKPFIESDFYWDKHTKPYKKLLVKQVNLIRESKPECRNMEPDVTKSTNKGSESNPVFFVMCGEDSSVHNVFFSKSEAENNTVPIAPTALDESVAVQKCIDEIKINATNPESVDAHYLLGKAYTAHPNGNVTVILNFDAKNGFGTEMENQARCVIQPNGKIDIWFEKS